VAILLPNRDPRTIEEHNKRFYAPSKPVREHDSGDSEDGTQQN
jgi:hypothetical protein